MPGAFITFDGESIPGRVPPRLIVRDNPMSKDQHNAVKHVYQEFARRNGLSLAGYHVNEARLSDGTRVRMESNNGVDRVTVWPGRSGYESLFDIRPLALFVSLSAPVGVLPGPPVYAPRAVGVTPTASLWSNPPLVRAQDLEFYHGYRSTFDYQNPAYSFPGTMDWYDDRGIESPNFGLVITWWPKYPHRYSSEITREKFSDPGLHNRKSIGLADVNFRDFHILERYVWCNGIIIAILPTNHAVEGACLHTRNDGSTVLRVITSRSDYYYVYEGLYQREKPPHASQTGLITLTQTQAIYRRHGRLLHPAHCNDTGTRAVMVMQTDMESGEYLWELDLETGSMTAVDVPWTPQGYLDNPARVQAGSSMRVQKEKDRTNSSSHAISSEQTNYRVIAADYRKGLLEYVYQKNRQSFSTQGTASHSRDEGHAEFTWTTTPEGFRHQIGESSGSANASTNYITTASQEFILKHSTLGELSRCVHGRSESESSLGLGSYDYSEEYFPDGGGVSFYNLTGGASSTTRISISFTGNTPGRVVAAGLAGDLRVRSFDIYLTYGNESERIKGYTFGRTVNIVNPSRGEIDSDLFETFGGPHNGKPQRTYVDRIRFVNGVKNGRSLITYKEKQMNASRDITEYLRSVNITGAMGSIVARAYRSTIDLTLSYGVVTHGGDTATGDSVEGLYITGTFYQYQVPTPPAANVRNAVIPICATSSFDGSLYYISSIDWPENGATIDDENDVVDVGRLLFNAKIYNAKTGKELVDLNADPNLNPCPGAGKTCTTMLFLGPVRDPNGRYNDRPMYLMEPE